MALRRKPGDDETRELDGAAAKEAVPDGINKDAAADPAADAGGLMIWNAAGNGQQEKQDGGRTMYRTGLY